MTRKILITGANGYIGARIAKRLSETSDYQIVPCQRPDVDLQNDDPFAAIDPKEIAIIVHSAAVTRFNVDAETAQQVNVEGTRKVIEFATKCDALEHVHLLSTIYASGLRPGLIPEEPVNDDYGFANNYELSKWQSEQLLLQSRNLPYSISRIATVIADDESGAVTQQNAFHNTLKLFYYGLLSVVPGKPDTPLYFVTGDFATEAICRITLEKAKNAIFHVAHTRDESPRLSELIDISFEQFNQDPAFSKRRVLKPLYCEEDSFKLLADGMATFGKGIMSQAVSSVSPFSQQLFIDKDVQNARLKEMMPSYTAPETKQFLRNTCQNLLDTRWGRQAALAH